MWAGYWLREMEQCAQKGGGRRGEGVFFAAIEARREKRIVGERSVRRPRAEPGRVGADALWGGAVGSEEDCGSDAKVAGCGED